MAASEGWTTVYTEPVEMSAPSGIPEDRATARAQPTLTTLVHQHAALLFRVAFSIVRRPAEAEDIVQEVFLRALQHPLADLRDPRLWLLRLTWNRAIDHRRRRRPEQIDDALSDALIARTPPADQLLSQQQQLTATLREINRLPQKERAILLLSAIDELTTAELAHVLHRSESATRSLLHRARTRLRDRLNQGGAR